MLSSDRSSDLSWSLLQSKKLKKSDFPPHRNGKINLPTLYLHRYVRLTPLLAVVFLVSMTLMRFLGDGPVWPIWIQFFSKPCETYWWSTLLYVQNYVNPRDFVSVKTLRAGTGFLILRSSS